MEKSAFKVWGLSMSQLLVRYQNYTIYASDFDLKHINNNDFAKVSKLQKITTTSTFSCITVWGLAQKRLVLKEWITFYE